MEILSHSLSSPPSTVATHYEKKLNTIFVTSNIFLGIITRVYRRCSSGSVFEQNPSLNEKCVSDYYLDGKNVDLTTCYLRCDDKDGCNDQTPGESSAIRPNG